MKITLKRTPEQIELVKAMASRNRTVAYDAQVALAEFIGPVLAEVVNNAPTLSNLFTSLPFNADDNPSIPLDLYYDITDEDYITVYSQSVAGGLPTNQVLPTASEMKVTTYSLDSALSFDRRYAAKHRMDVVAKTFTRMAQEILLKQERTSATLVMSTLAAASTNSKAHVQRSNQSGRFLLADLNELLTLAKRINTSWTKGTPASGARAGISDLLVSPEIVEQIRAMAYNPVNTISGITASGGTASSVGIPATDEMRSAIYGSAGIPSFYGVSILEFNEMGKSQKFNTIFDTAAGATAYTTAAGGSSGAFDGANEEILVGIDRSRDSLLRVVATDPDSNSEFSLVADDQYSIRQNKIGYFGSLEEGRVILDVRALVGKIV
jgi:3D (Asp-Asp-Asp) domain-containing protein